MESSERIVRLMAQFDGIWWNDHWEQQESSFMGKNWDSSKNESRNSHLFASFGIAICAKKLLYDFFLRCFKLK